ncbi:MAG: aldo/keto reductase [Bryobacteraceae bacterium]|jgi:aryl-alcohol dehydrogenase-like predicted oxidoreductase
MENGPSRRNFLAAGLVWPAAASASRSLGAGQSQTQPGTGASSGAAVQYRMLGKTGMRVTTVGFGCMITSDPTVITRAVDMGINYFDTARNYQNGQNERMVGAALGARRKDVFLASKSNDNPKSGPEILAEIETSLKELKTDHLDVWHLHGLNSAAEISDEVVAAERKAKEQGKIRFTGVSTHNLPAIVDRVLEAKIEVVQAQYNFAADKSYGPAIEKLHAAGVGLIAMKVMARSGSRGRAPRPATFAPAALKWTINNPGIATTVPSMTDIDQLEQNFKAMSERFGDADAKILSARLEEIGPYFCRMCGRCEGQCPKGLPVADMVRFVMYADGYGQFPLGRERFVRMSAEQQSVRCGDCADCAVHCPNGVDVAARLKRAQELFG